MTAVQETLDKTNLGTWEVGYEVNLERSMKMDGRFDGHIVQGHVDQTAVCRSVEETVAAGDMSLNMIPAVAISQWKKDPSLSTGSA